MKAAQIAFVGQTVMFLVSAVVLLLAGKALAVALGFAITSVLGYAAFLSMLLSDAGLTTPKPATP